MPRTTMTGNVSTIKKGEEDARAELFHQAERETGVDGSLALKTNSRKL